MTTSSLGGSGEEATLALQLPAGARWCTPPLDLATGSRLRLEAVDVEGAGAARLLVEWQAAAGPGWSVIERAGAAAGEAAGTDLDLPLPQGKGRLAPGSERRFSLRRGTARRRSRACGQRRPTPLDHPGRVRRPARRPAEAAGRRPHRTGARRLVAAGPSLRPGRLSRRPHPGRSPAAAHRPQPRPCRPGARAPLQPDGHIPGPRLFARQPGCEPAGPGGRLPLGLPGEQLLSDRSAAVRALLEPGQARHGHHRHDRRLARPVPPLRRRARVPRLLRLDAPRLLVHAAPPVRALRLRVARGCRGATLRLRRARGPCGRGDRRAAARPRRPRPRGPHAADPDGRPRGGVRRRKEARDRALRQVVEPRRGTRRGDSLARDSRTAGGERPGRWRVAGPGVDTRRGADDPRPGWLHNAAAARRPAAAAPGRSRAARPAPGVAGLLHPLSARRPGSAGVVGGRVREPSRAGHEAPDHPAGGAVAAGVARGHGPERPGAARTARQAALRVAGRAAAG